MLEITPRQGRGIFEGLGIVGGISAAGAGLGAATAVVLGGPGIMVGCTLLGIVHVLTGVLTGELTYGGIAACSSQNTNLTPMIAIAITIAAMIGSTLATWGMFVVAGLGAAIGFMASLIFSGAMWGGIIAVASVAAAIYIMVKKLKEPDINLNAQRV